MTTAVFTSLRDSLASMAERERLDPESYPHESIKALYDAGVIIAPFRAELGGAGWTLPDAVQAIEAIASASPSTALIASMPLGLACTSGLVGSDRSRGRGLP
jgi:alkylation response protein AidB-like acyl-CoA dehydrogenase